MKSTGLPLASSLTARFLVASMSACCDDGILAAPVMVMLMLMVRNPKVMGDLVVRGRLYAIGWASTVAMAFYIVGMLITLFLS